LSSEASLPSLAATRRTEPKRLTAMMRGELDWMVMKCLEKDRNRRYATVNGLVRDVQRYLADEAVEARPPSAGYKLRKFLRRNKGPVLAAAAMAVLLVSGLAVSTWQAVRATRAEGAAQERREAAEKAESLVRVERDAANKERQRAEENEAKAQHHLYIANMHRIRFELENNNVAAARALLDLYRPGTGAGIQPGWEWYYWDRVCHAELLTLKGHPGRVMDVAYSSDGSLLASAGGDDDPVVKIWNSVTGDELRALHGHDYLVSQVAFSPDGKLLATCSGATGTVKLWEVATWTELPNWKPQPGGEFQRVAFSPNGKTLAISEAKSKRVRFWDLAREAWVGQLPEGTNSGRIQYSPDGSLIAIASDGVQVWDVNKATLLRTLTGHSFNDVQQANTVSDDITGLTFSPDGQLLATCSRDGTVKLRKVLDGTEVRSITVMSARLASFSGLTDLAFSPNGKYLVTSSFSGPLKLWEVGTGRELRSFFGQVDAEAVAFSPDGTRLASAGWDGEVKIWDAAGEPGQQLFLNEMYAVYGPSFSPDGKLLAEEFPYGMKTGQVRVSDANTGRLVLRPDHGSFAHVTAFAFSSDSTRIAAASYRHDPETYEETGQLFSGSVEVRIWDLKTQQHIGTIAPFDDRIHQIAFSPSDQVLATVTDRYDSVTTKWLGEVKLWDAKTLQASRTFPGLSIAFSPTGTTVAVVGNDQTVAICDVETGQVLRALPPRAGRTDVSFSPDGNELCDGSMVWDISDGRQLYELKGNTSPAQFSRDGMRLFSMKVDTRASSLLQVWDAATGHLLSSIPVQADSRVSLHPDGWRVAVSSLSMGTWIVDARPLTSELRLERDAHNLVAHLVRQPLLKDEILDKLKQMNTISDSLRREALVLAENFEPPADILEVAAWDIVQYADRSDDQYRRALRWLEEANQLHPNNGAILSSLGLALYRLGRLEEAVINLEHAFKINMSGYYNPPRRDLVCLAMVQHQLGRNDQARKTFARSQDDEIKNRETAPRHLVREAEALIAGKMYGPSQHEPSTLPTR
jgi:WD40 repeat protein